MAIGISGASGQLGRDVAARLLDLADAADVVLASRTVDALAEFATQGAHVRVADFGDPSSLPTAFDGVDSLLLISTDRLGDRVTGHLAAIEAARTAGVRHVVYTSVPNPSESNPALVAADHLATETALRASGLAWTFLRNNLYAETQLPALVHAAADGRLVTNWGDGRAAFVARTDCAAAAVGALTGQGQLNRAYDVTGPRAWSAYDLAALAGAHVEVIHVDDAAFARGLIGSGVPEHAAHLVTSFGRATREGYLDGVTSAVSDLGGYQPTPLEALARLRAPTNGKA